VAWRAVSKWVIASLLGREQSHYAAFYDGDTGHGKAATLKHVGFSDAVGVTAIPKIAGASMYPPGVPVVMRVNALVNASAMAVPAVSNMVSVMENRHGHLMHHLQSSFLQERTQFGREVQNRAHPGRACAVSACRTGYQLAGAGWVTPATTTHSRASALTGRGFLFVTRIAPICGCMFRPASQLPPIQVGQAPWPRSVHAGRVFFAAPIPAGASQEPQGGRRLLPSP
jgi:hypothetical protein